MQYACRGAHRVVAAHLLAPPVNVLGLSLPPDGMPPHILSLAESRDHLLG